MAFSYVKHDEEFFGVFKLVNGEEVLAKAVIAVLINGGSASASEIFARGIQVSN